MEYDLLDLAREYWQVPLGLSVIGFSAYKLSQAFHREKYREKKALRNDVMEYYDEIVGDEEKREDFQKKIVERLS